MSYMAKGLEGKTQENIEMKLNFSDIFRLTEDGRFEPKRVIRLTGQIIYPGQAFRMIGREDFAKYIDCKFATLEKEGILEITGYYEPDNQKEYA